MESVYMHLDIRKLLPHPKNVRKDVGDVSELAASIRAKGIMQSLLVVPAPGHEDDMGLFYVVIGNRRLAAAKMANVTFLPCTVAFDLGEQEQIEAMLAENLQRSDLTPVEEAQAYEQLTLDFGLSTEDIAEKTGISASTVRRRLKICELDADEIKRKGFQLSIGDYDTLGRIKDPKTRNKVLAAATSSSNLRFLVDRYVTEEASKESLASLLELLKGSGIKVASEKTPGATFFRTINLQELDKSSKDQLVESLKQYSQVTITPISESLACIHGTTRAEEKKMEDTKVSRDELIRQKRERDHKFVIAKYKDIAADIRAFIASVIDGVYGLPKGSAEQAVQERLWRLLCRIDTPILGARTLAAYWKGCDVYDVADSYKETMGGKATWIQMLAAAGKATSASNYLCKYGYEYHEEHGETVTRLVDFLGVMGFSLRDQEERPIIEGSHDCWERYPS